MHPLIERFSGYSPERILVYFQSRTNIDYFPVSADAGEVTRFKMDAVTEGRFVLNGEEHTLSHPADWTRNPAQDREWLILLHKFYYAVGLGKAFQDTGDPRYASSWIQLTRAWIENVPLDFLSSDVVGRRLQNWVFAHYYFVTACSTPLVTPDFYLRFLTSLREQTEWLRHHLTPARNHRTLELTAIFLVAAVFPELQGASEWLEFAVLELTRNMQTDLLPDGVHCELSTDYHHIVLRNYLVVRRLAGLNGILLPPEMDDHLRRALEFAKWAHRPDGWIPSLSDGDSGSFLDLLQQGYELYGDPEMLYVATGGRAGSAPQERTRCFPQGGYSVLRSGWGDREESYLNERYLIFDCGPLGAGNHGHLDLLHFEAFAYGRPLVIDPGRYTYHEGEGENWRARFRGTSYHNTVTVDGRNQTLYELDKTRYKVRGPYPEQELRSFVSGREIDYIQALCKSHEYEAVHERRIVFVRDEYWVITDVLSAQEHHEYDLWFHLPADAQDHVRIVGGCVETPHLTLAFAPEPDTQVLCEEGFVAPQYGVRQEAPIIRVNRSANSTVFHTVLLPQRYQRRTVEVAREGVFGVRVTIHNSARGSVRDTISFDSAGKPAFERAPLPQLQELANR